MPRLLVLVRHGDPENTSITGEDRDRALTPQGLSALKHAYPQIFGLLHANSVVRIWSSTALRARQTAEVILEAFPDAEIETFDVLYEQDTETIISMIDASEAEVLVVVGHVPFVEELALYYLGMLIPFNKGAVAAIEPVSREASETASPKGILKWYVRGPKVAPTGVLSVAERELKEASVDLKDSINSFLENPEDPQKLYLMRVSQRRVRSLVEFLAPWMDHVQNRRVVEGVQRLQRSSSRLRAFDLLQRAVMGLIEGGDLACNTSLDKVCKIERSVECASFVTFMDSDEIAKSIEIIAEDLAKPSWNAEVLDKGLEQDALSEHFYRECSSLADEFWALDLSDDNALFHARHNTKEMHYVAERLGSVIGKEKSQITDLMNYFQSDLAILVDAIRNRNLAKECSKSPRFKGLRSDLVVVARDQEELISAVISGIKRREQSDGAPFDTAVFLDTNT